ASTSSSFIRSLPSNISLICARLFLAPFLFLPSRLQLFFFFPPSLLRLALDCDDPGDEEGVMA
ncbi:hypothetical protein PFISCL1PPCAC_22823, partial [Pristionchus fissidentatus]